MDDIENFKRAVQQIISADSLIITAGAGIGVDSGLPDFRGNEGFWKAYPALAKAQLNFTEIASPFAFKENIRRAWGFYGHRLNLYRNTNPHEGFSILKKWGEAKPKKYFIFTSNVDGQFQKSGFDSQHIYECHGSIHHLQCLKPCNEKIWDAKEFHPEINQTECQLTNMHPLCQHCGGYARPNILMFSDDGWLSERSDQQSSRLHKWLDQINNPAVIELGAGTHVPSVRHFSERVCTLFNVPLIRINPREAEVRNLRDVSLSCGALEALSKLDDQLHAIK